MKFKIGDKIQYNVDCKTKKHIHLIIATDEHNYFTRLIETDWVSSKIRINGKIIKNLHFMLEQNYFKIGQIVNYNQYWAKLNEV